MTIMIDGTCFLGHQESGKFENVDSVYPRNVFVYFTVSGLVQLTPAHTVKSSCIIIS